MSFSLSFPFFLTQQLVFNRQIRSLDSLDLLGKSSLWISTLLTQDSLTDSHAGFGRWSRSQLALDPFTAITGFARWICLLLTLDLLGKFILYSPAPLLGYSY